LVFRAIVVQQRFRKALLLHLLHMYLNECKNAHFAAAALIQIVFGLSEKKWHRISAKNRVRFPV
jgi:hypothetical protein